MPLLQAKLTKKAPYSQYGALAGEGVTVAWGDPADTTALPSDSFDVVYDNNGKDMAACQPAIDHFKVCAAAWELPSGHHCASLQGGAV